MERRSTALRLHSTLITGIVNQNCFESICYIKQMRNIYRQNFEYHPLLTCYKSNQCQTSTDDLMFQTQQ